MASWNWFGKAHAWVLRKTGGRIGGRLAGIPMLLLTTKGRRSGQPRTTPLAYMMDGDDFVVFASNNGQDRHPLWWLNLEADDAATVEAGGEAYRVRGAAADSEERDALWPRMIAVNRTWASYPEKTTRKIPVVVLRREA